MDIQYLPSLDNIYPFYTQYYKLDIKSSNIFSDYCLKDEVTFLFLPITGGKVSELSVPHLITAQALIIEMKQLQIIQSKAIKDQEEAQQALKNSHRIHQQLKLQLEQNMTLSDGLQRQLETLQLERAVLMSDSSHIRERLLHSFFFLKKMHFRIKPFKLLVVT